MPFELTKSLPKPGGRFALPTLYGSSDAWALARAAAALKAEKRMLTVVVANASDGQRLLTELPWFAADLACHLLPDWETLPYDAFSPHQDLVSERLATLHEIQNRQCDVLIVPATTALVRLAPPSFTCSTWSATPSRASAPLTPTPSARCIPCTKCACCRGANSLWTTRPAPPSAAAGANSSKAIHRARWSTRTSAAASPRPVSSITCRCFSKKRRPCTIICRQTPHWPWWAISTPPSAASGPIPSRATAS